MVRSLHRILKQLNVFAAAFAAAVFTVEINLLGIDGLVTEVKAMWTFTTLEVRTDATARPKAAFTVSKSAAGVTPLASMLPMAVWWAYAAALRRFPSMALPITTAMFTASRT